MVNSRHVLDELARVPPRLNHRLHWGEANFTELLEILSFQADLAEPLPLPPAAVRDAADVPVLGTFPAAGADYLITGDQDLLAPADRHPILTPADFWRRHGG